MLVEVHDEEADAPLHDEMENDLHRIGVTGVEDRLHSEVIETTESTHRAGICMWVVTGDRTEMAINVEKACGDIKSECVEVIKAEQTTFKRRHAFSAVVTGDVLESFKGANFREFIEYLLPVEAVVWCHTTQKNKAVIEAIQKNPKKTVLAIDNGWNGVAMVKTEDVGIGLFGKEWTQAAQTGDNAIPKFRHLQKLLLNSGMKAYRGVAFVIKMSFFKNVCSAMLQFWYGFLCGWSGQTFYEDRMASVNNFAITFLPPVVAGIVDVVLSFYETKLYPEVYGESAKHPRFATVRTSFLRVLFAFYQSAVIFGLDHFLVTSTDVLAEDGNVNGDGHTTNIDHMMVWNAMINMLLARSGSTSPSSPCASSMFFFLQSTLFITLLQKYQTFRFSTSLSSTPPSC